MNKKKRSDFIALIESNDDSKIISALNKITNVVDISLLPHIFNLLEKNMSKIILDECFFVLSNIKNSSAIEYYIQALNTGNFGNNISGVLAACWQSGLNFSKHLSLFTGFFIKSDYKTAIEAFTVIEEALINADKAFIVECRTILKENVQKIDAEKQSLYNELIKLVEGYI